MNPVITLLLLPAGLAGLSADQFQVLAEQLCQELAPATPLENVLVAQVISYLGRLRKAAMAEPEDKVNDRDWLRYHQMAERGFWKHYNELMKGRRQKARSAPKADVQPAAPAPAPAPAHPAPTPQPAAPAPTAAAPARRPIYPPARPERAVPRRPIRPEIAALAATWDPSVPPGVSVVPVAVGVAPARNGSATS